MRDEVRQQLSRLVGLPLTAPTRAGSMLTLQLGAMRALPAPISGRMREVGEYALHVQCPWRITHRETGIVVGAGDMFVPVGDSETEPPDWDWEARGANHADHQLAAWAEKLPLVVASVDADALGGFRLALKRDYALEAFPMHAHAGEHWRLFTPGDNSSHFVVTSRGIED